MPSPIARNVLIVGASRGLGLEFVRQYRADGASVTATARADDGLAAIAALGAKALKLDVADAASAAGLAWQIDGEAFDTVFYVAGVYGPRSAGLEPPSVDDFDAVMHTNVLGAMRVLPLGGRRAGAAGGRRPGARIGVVSSRMGSIGAAQRHRGLDVPRLQGRRQLGAEGRLDRAGRPRAVRRVPPRLGAHRDGRLRRRHRRRPNPSPACAARSPRSTPPRNGSFLNYDGTPLAW